MSCVGAHVLPLAVCKEEDEANNVFLRVAASL